MAEKEKYIYKNSHDAISTRVFIDETKVVKVDDVREGKRRHDKNERRNNIRDRMLKRACVVLFIRYLRHIKSIIAG